MCSAIAFRIGVIGFAEAVTAVGRRGRRVGHVRRLCVKRPRLASGDRAHAWGLTPSVGSDPLFEVRDQVLLADPAADAMPLDLREVHVVLVGHAADDGGDESGAVTLGRRIGPVLRGPRVVRRLIKSRRGTTTGVDLRDRLADWHGVAGLGDDAREDARCRAWDLDVHLVGCDVADRLVGLDLIADGLPPLEDRPLGDGDAHLGHRDGDRLCQ